ncbi:MULTISPECIES: TetR/AcrR family transcriptional regulator [unclassified Leptospira]|uniref:TetR/AcrR family transcriptional regulator n=1 Tax=unclassified Leptospira TaxID=2633828 RepID=UPI0002BFE189|nr:MULTISPECIES: TetR/AcrR family transcriptional regulator [unclassified Leptospira]EMK02250.1 transcriptional regulator, TetR family [Leptospira sp. B5-022]MCR1793644.1 TetR/AcrR family transcriptional regulator [Leptospira sp. id769339]
MTSPHKKLLPKRERTRLQILKAALKLFARKDAGEASISDVIAEAEIANGTFYNHFKTKEELLEASSLTLIESLASEVETIMGDMDDPAERMALAGIYFFKKARMDSNWAWALIRVAAVTPRMSDILLSYPLRDLQRGITSGKFSIESTETALGLFVGSLHYGIRNILEGRAKNKLHDREMMTLVLRGYGVKIEIAKKLASKGFERAWKEE